MDDTAWDLDSMLPMISSVESTVGRSGMSMETPEEDSVFPSEIDIVDSTLTAIDPADECDGVVTPRWAETDPLNEVAIVGKSVEGFSCKFNDVELGLG